MANIRSYRELRIYRNAFDSAMQIFNLTKTFPVEERYSLVDQIRRSSQAVCSNLAEAWRKRRYPAHFVSKLSDAEGEADETSVWLEFSLSSGYIGQMIFDQLDEKYDLILGQLTKMHSEPEKWSIKQTIRQ